jgi:hypothetical protein
MTVFPTPIIRIHSLAGAQSACRVMGHRPFSLLSGEYAALSSGAQWFGDLITLVRDEFPDADFMAILDCRGRVSSALVAIEIGLNGVIIDPLPDAQLSKLCDMSRQIGCDVIWNIDDLGRVIDMKDPQLPDHELDRRLRLQTDC